MHHPTGRITHTTAFDTRNVEHWLEQEIAQWVHPMKDRSDDPSHHERTLLPLSYISLPFIDNLYNVLSCLIKRHSILTLFVSISFLLSINTHTLLRSVSQHWCHKVMAAVTNLSSQTQQLMLGSGHLAEKAGDRSRQRDVTSHQTGHEISD